MSEFKYKVSVIVPIYNMEAYLEKCLDSVVAQTIDKDLIEVLLINDGSKDSSAEIMARYSKAHKFFREIHKENEGLSKTRNRGIREAKGKYIMYLDADDTLTPETIKNVTDFFDEHYDEIDLVSYYEEIRKLDNTILPHYRHAVLNETGVYDLTKLENAFCSQTNINICVKNLGEENVYFDTNKEFRQEDQKYCTEILLKKLKLGYCAEGTYQYLKNANSATNTWFYAYYLFEPAMKYWEDLFSQYEKGKVPYYIQAMCINDIVWKSKSDILLPYHYPEEELERAKRRVLDLIEEVSDEIIVNHPNIDPLQSPYFILMKEDNDIAVNTNEDHVEITNHGNTIYKEKDFHIVISKIRVRDDSIHFEGHVKSPVFSFVDKPEIYLLQNGSTDGIQLELGKSSYGYYKSKIEMSRAWGFELTIDSDECKKFELVVAIGTNRFKTYYTFRRPVQLSAKRTMIVRDNTKLEYDEPYFKIRRITKKEQDKHFRRLLIRGLRSNRYMWRLRNRAWRLKNRKTIWLYYDCKGVPRDNGYYQFEHDFQIADGVDRYYIVNEDDFSNAVKNYPAEYRNKIVKFGSTKHKELFLACEKIVSAYGERVNLHPFIDPADYKKYLDLFDYPEVYYLQHGVLHAHVPWKYSYDRTMIEKEIISTRFEEENLKNNYCFSDRHLAKVGMPRYDRIDSEKQAVTPRRILFAPSWRKYLIGNEGLEWVATEDRFKRSEFFKETQAFLNSRQLHELLEKNDLYLDFKAHPIFERYNDLYGISNDRVCIADKKVEESDYSIFITDFSSFVYDFAYLRRPVIYFVPDYTLFKSGMNFYRQLDMPVEDGLGELAVTGDEAVEAIRRIIENGYESLPKYQERLEGFFFYYDNNQCSRVYEAVRSKE